MSLTGRFKNESRNPLTDHTDPNYCPERPDGHFSQNEDRSRFQEEQRGAQSQQANCSILTEKVEHPVNQQHVDPGPDSPASEPSWWELPNIPWSNPASTPDSCSILDSCSAELEKFCGDPLGSLTDTCSQFLTNSTQTFIDACSFIYESICALPKLLVEVAMYFVDSLRGWLEALAEAFSKDAQAESPEKVAARANPIAAPRTFNEIESSDEDEQLSPTQAETTELDSPKKKTPGELLLEAVLQVAAALYAKREEKEHSIYFEEPAERKQRLEQEAVEATRQAISLRPDLAKVIQIPDTDCILPSAFGEVPLVEAIIDAAEKAQIDKFT